MSIFRYPKNLFENFNRIKYCDLVQNKVHTDEALKEFETCLNDAQPLTEEDLQHELFSKNLYRGKPEMFINLIKNRNSECLILWTESKQIVRFFQLYGFIYIQYNKDTRRYKVLKHRRLGDPNYKPTSYQSYGNNNHENSNYNEYTKKNSLNEEEYPSLPGASSSSSSSSGNGSSFRNKILSSLLDEVTVPDTSTDPESIQIDK